MENRKKIACLSIYPAPYRFELQNEMKKSVELDMFFESADGHGRNADWFVSNVKILKTINDRWHFLNEVVKRKYSIVLLYDSLTKFSIITMIICLMKKVPYIVNADGAMRNNNIAKGGTKQELASSNKIREIIKKFFFVRADACFASGNCAKKYFVDCGVNESNIFIHTFTSLFKNDILDEPLNFEEKLDFKNELGLNGFEKIAIAAGRFIPLKNYDKLITAWYKMPKQFGLVIIGGGEEQHKYEKFISEHQIENIVIIDFIPKSQLQKYFKAADLFVHPTMYDVWGLVINEAMACGLPVLSTNKCVAGIELIKDGVNGYLNEAGNSTLLFEKLNFIFAHCDLTYMGINSIKAIREYTYENAASLQLAGINSVLLRYNKI